jgi:predicted ATPase/class 3 adenylate cyclase
LAAQTLTFLFTDIEGSTAMLRRLGAVYAELLSDHHRLIRAQLAAHGGREIDTQGDAFFAVFSSASSCVTAAIGMQRALASHIWPGGEGLRVRMGIHSGEASETAVGPVGLDVHRGARIAAVGHGGQVLVSATTAALVRDSMPAGAYLRDVGRHWLKDFGRAEQLFQLEADGLQVVFPPLRSLEHAKVLTNLPAPVSSCIGRDDELGELQGLITGSRLVTLTGAGGAGKTRLAVELAGRVGTQFADGAWLADLSGINEVELVRSVVMEALGVRQEAGVPVLEALLYRLRSAQLLLVLDNCEHLLDECAGLVGELLGYSPGLHVLATSREPLAVPGEVAYRVAPLQVPPESAGEQVIAQAPAVRLFLERGSAARRGVSAGAVPVVAAGRICRKLDGLPLAIELAAGWLGTLSAAEIEANLVDALRFLSSRRRATDPRHRALQAAMDWSYDLLPAADRDVFAQLSVFASSFGLEQAAAVCGAGDPVAALEVIDRLAGKSLVAAEPAENGTRYRLLETMRQYAAARLAESGHTSAAEHRHARAFLALAERERNLVVLSRDHDNFRAALEWSLSVRDEAGPRLAHALGDFWLARGLLQEGRGWLERALAQCPTEQRLRAGLLRLLGAFLYETGDRERAEAVLREGFEAAAAAGAPALQARIQVLLADIGGLQGADDPEILEAAGEAAAAVLDSEADLAGLAEAWTLIGNVRKWPADREAFERAMDYARQSGNHRAHMQASHWLAVAYATVPVPADAGLARVEQLLQAASGEPWAEADLLKPLGMLYAYTGRIDQARAAFARSRSLFARFGAKFALAESSVPHGLMELAAGDPAAAERYLREGYEVLRAMGERGWLNQIAALLAEARRAQGGLDEALQLTNEVQAAAAPGNILLQAWWRVTRAQVLAQRGQFAAARQLADEAQALISPTPWKAEQARVLVAKAEVDRLAGAPDQAAASLRAALQIYEDQRITLLAEQARTALASLATRPGREPA